MREEHYVVHIKQVIIWWTNLFERCISTAERPGEVVTLLISRGLGQFDPLRISAITSEPSYVFLLCYSHLFQWSDLGVKC